MTSSLQGHLQLVRITSGVKWVIIADDGNIDDLGFDEKVLCLIFGLATRHEASRFRRNCKSRSSPKWTSASQNDLDQSCKRKSKDFLEDPSEVGMGKRKVEQKWSLCYENLVS
jgi:hypothetical protein